MGRKSIQLPSKRAHYVLNWICHQNLSQKQASRILNNMRQRKAD